MDHTYYQVLIVNEYGNRNPAPHLGSFIKGIDAIRTAMHLANMKGDTYEVDKVTKERIAICKPDWKK